MKHNKKLDLLLMRDFLEKSKLSYAQAAEILGFSDSQKICDVMHGRRGLTSPRKILMAKYLADINSRLGF